MHTSKKATTATSVPVTTLVNHGCSGLHPLHPCHLARFNPCSRCPPCLNLRYNVKWIQHLTTPFILSMPVMQYPHLPPADHCWEQGAERLHRWCWWWGRCSSAAARAACCWGCAASAHRGSQGWSLGSKRRWQGDIRAQKLNSIWTR